MKRTRTGTRLPSLVKDDPTTSVRTGLFFNTGAAVTSSDRMALTPSSFTPSLTGVRVDVLERPFAGGYTAGFQYGAQMGRIMANSDRASGEYPKPLRWNLSEADVDIVGGELVRKVGYKDPAYLRGFIDGYRSAYRGVTLPLLLDRPLRPVFIY